MKNIFLIIISITLSACASMQKSTILGAVIGSTVGGLLGNTAGNHDNRGQSTLIGASLGAGLGGLIGYSSYQEKEKKDQQAVLKDNPLNLKAPSLTSPKVRRVWVPSKIEGDKYIDGHYMYVIEKTSTWSE